MEVPLDARSVESDAVLLARFANGDRAAAHALSLRLAPKAMSYASRVLRDRAEAEDVTQEAMLRLWRIAPEWRDGEAQVTTWFYRVVANLCTDRLRKTKATNLDDVPEPPDPRATGDSVLQDNARAAALEAALSELPDRQRQAVVLRHIENLPNPEIAQIMDIGVEAVESLTARGKRALKAALNGRKEELGFENG